MADGCWCSVVGRSGLDVKAWGSLVEGMAGGWLLDSGGFWWFVAGCYMLVGVWCLVIDR